MAVVLIATAIIAVVPLAMWVAWLRFLRWLVQETKDPKALRDAAVAASAFRVSALAAFVGAAARAVSQIKR